MKGGNLNSLLRDLEKRIRGTLGKNIQVILNLADLIDRVEIDPGQVEWVLMNLMANALSRMPDGGRVTITTANVLRAGGGPGKEAAPGSWTRRHAKLSISYVQNGEIPGQDFPMSLAIMNGVLGKRGGEIWWSGGRERETIISVFFPIRPEDPEAPTSPKTEKKAPRGSRWWQSLWRTEPPRKDPWETGELAAGEKNGLKNPGSAGSQERE